MVASEKAQSIQNRDCVLLVTSQYSDCTLSGGIRQFKTCILRFFTTDLIKWCGVRDLGFHCQVKLKVNCIY